MTRQWMIQSLLGDYQEELLRIPHAELEKQHFIMRQVQKETEPKMQGMDWTTYPCRITWGVHADR